MRGDTHASRPFKNTTYVDYLVGWKYLFNQHYRAHVHHRWSNQSWLMSGAEVMTGIGSILFSSTLLSLLIFIIWDGWFRY
jgi:hypothetical protein